MSSHLLDLENSKKFILAGNSTFTVVSKSTGKRYTFKVKSNDSEEVFFVSYLISGDEKYRFLGTIFKNNTSPYKYFPSRKKTDPKSVVNRTFEWVYNTILTNNQSNFDKIEFWHEGKCGRCGRKLTVPSSIERGLGAFCATR